MTSPDPAPPRPRVHVLTLRPDGAREDTARRVGAVLAEAFATDPVSYTHLTLPTIYSV